MGQGFVMQPWTTVRGNVAQDSDEWLRLGAYADVAFVIDVSDVSGGPVSIALESAPAPDEALFLPLAPAPSFSAPTTSPLVVKSVRAASTAPLGALARWRVTGSGGITFRIRAVPGKTSFFSPLDVPGLQLWTRADMGVTLDGGTSRVIGWSDQSGLGRDLSAPSGSGQRPSLVASGVNGLPAVSFDPTSGAQWLSSASFSLGVYTAVVVATAQNATNGFFFTRSSGATGVDTLYGSTFCTMYVDRGTGTQSCREYAASWGKRVSQGGTLADAGGHLLLVHFDGTAAGHGLRVDGQEIAVTTHAGYGDPGTGTNGSKLTLGARDDGNLPAATSIAEALLYDHPLTADETKRVEEYLRRRYRLY